MGCDSTTRNEHHGGVLLLRVIPPVVQGGPTTSLGGGRLPRRGWGPLALVQVRPARRAARSPAGPWAWPGWRPVDVVSEAGVARERKAHPQLRRQLLVSACLCGVGVGKTVPPTLGVCARHAEASEHTAHANMFARRPALETPSWQRPGFLPASQDGVALPERQGPAPRAR